MIARRFQRLFFPRSIAVVGASRNPKKLGAVVVNNVLAADFRGTVFAVNPNTKRVGTIRSFARVGDVPRTPDLVIVATPAETVPAILLDCGRARVKNVIVLSAGFGERGGAGTERERDVRALARKYHFNLLGPNCLGLTFGEHRLNASFGEALDRDGSIVLLSQSGAMAAAMADWAKTSGVRFRAMVSLGNKAGIDEVDMLEAFGHDRETKAIVLYVESMERGKEFLGAVSRITKRIPVVVLKGGASALAQRAAVTHTGALATPHRLVTAALTQSGCIVAPTLEAFFDLARLLALPPPVGRRVAVLTNAGGPGIMAMEAMSRSVTLAPARVPAGNPLDVLGDANAVRFRKGLQAVARSAADSVCVLLTRQVMTDAIGIAREIAVAAKRDFKKRYVAVLLGGKPLASARRFLFEHGVPVFDYPESAINALSVLAQRTAPSYAPPRVSSQIFSQRGLLLSPAATRLVRTVGIATTPERFGVTERDVMRAGQRIGFPVVLKRISGRLPHKRAKGGVWLNLKSERELRAAFRNGSRKFKERAVGDGWLVQPFRARKSEYFVGARRDASFGPLLLVGYGGSGVEERPDVHVLYPPFSHANVRSALREFPVQERSAVATVASKLGALLLAKTNITDIDINPLFVDGKTAEAADVRILVS